MYLVGHEVLNRSIGRLFVDPTGGLWRLADITDRRRYRPHSNRGRNGIAEPVADTDGWTYRNQNVPSRRGDRTAPDR